MLGRTVFGVALVLALPMAAQNSTRKLREPPSDLAQRAGTALPWLDSLPAALAAAGELRRPVFWFVPTVAGSPMDRKPEIERYMAAGPFSWPSTIALLGQHFVTVRAVPSGELQRRYGLLRGRFIEPGWLVLDAEGTELARLDRITTLQPEWFEAPLRRLIGVPAPARFGAEPLEQAWIAYRERNLAECELELERVLQQEQPEAILGEALFLRGACAARQNRKAAARGIWQALGERHPGSPWAWKAAMEAEGHGPFTRGFEDFLPLPQRVLRDVEEGSRAPTGTYTEEQLWLAGVRFLLAIADEDGIVRDSTYDFGGTDSLPNVHAAVTFLAGEALLAARQRAAAGALTFRAEERKAIDARLDQVLAVACSEDQFALADRDEILWARAYALRFLARWLRAHPADQERLRPHLQAAVHAVAALQPANGVWFHEYGNPFAIATALQVLALAREVEVPVPADVIERGLRALLQCRASNGAFTYQHPGRRPANAPVEGAAGRMPLCELALLLWGRADQESLRGAVHAGFEHHGRLAAVRKYDDHADALGYGGFFFWFDMLGRTEATLRLEDASERRLRLAQQKKLVLDLPEFDGCFVDSHELGRAYGTAMALLCLRAIEGGG